MFEYLIGLAVETLHFCFKLGPFDEMYGAEVYPALVNKKLKKTSGNKLWLFSDQHSTTMILRDGRTSQFFENPITIGFAYMLKLIHGVANKSNVRSSSPYSLVIQQQLDGRSNQIGQRFG